MFKDKNKKISTLTMILLVINIALAVLIAVSFVRKTGTPGGDEMPGILSSSPMPEKTPDVVPQEPIESADPNETETAPPEPQETTETELLNNRPEVKKDPEGRRPDYSDFDWYFHDVQQHGMYADAARITDPGEVLGEWKAYILYDPENMTEESCEMLFKLNISVGQYDIELLCDWYYSRYFSKEEPEYEEGSTHYRGSWDNGAISATGSGTMNLNGFYEKDGRQYGLGTMNSKNGVPAVIVLVRP